MLLAILLVTSTALGWTQSAAPASTRAITADEQKLVDNVTIASLKETVNALAADEMQGRGTGQPGGDKAAAYLADRFAKLGLKPLGSNNTYLQPIKFRETQFLPQTAFTVGDQNLKFGTDYFVMPPLSGEKNVKGSMYFVGYGVSVPALNRDDFAGIDVRGKIAMLREGPLPGYTKEQWKKAGAQFNIFRGLIQRGVAGIVIIGQDQETITFSEMADYLTRRQIEPEGEQEMPDFLPPFISISEDAANKLFVAAGTSKAEAFAKADAEGFKPIAQLDNTISGDGTENPTDGTEPIPNAERGLFFQNRVFIPFRRDQVAVSDYLNYTRYSPVFSAFRINQGSSDALVTLGRFNETTLIAFKEQSIYAIGNITGDLGGATLYEVTSEYGCQAPKSVVAIGKDLWFLADKRGVCSITLTEQNKIQGRDVPVSQEIQKTIDRINWRYAAGATAAYWQNRLYMAVPLDNAEVAKASLIPEDAVYDSNGVYVVSVRTGRQYRWRKGANDLGVANGQGYTSFFNGSGEFHLDGFIPGARYLWTPSGTATNLLNGAEDLVANDGAQVFVAAGASVTFLGAPGAFMDEALGEVFREESGDVTPAGGFTSMRLFGTPEQPVTATFQSLFRGINNAVLVYDFEAGKWSGHDESDVLMVKDSALTTVHGKQRLVYFGADGTLNLYEEGAYDEDVLGETDTTIVLKPVVSRLVSRGYLFDTLEPKSFLRLLATFATLNPTYSIELLTDGAGESFTLALDRTKNRLKYYRPHDAPDWNPNNIDGDYLLPFREDYAWVLGEGDQIYLDEPIDPDLMQEIEEKFWAKGRGKYAQVQITNRTGRMEVKSLSLEAVLASKRFGVHA